MRVSNSKLFQKYKEAQNTVNQLGQQIKKRNLDWQFLASNNLKVLAMMRCQEQMKCSLVQAKAIVETQMEINQRDR